MSWFNCTTKTKLYLTFMICLIMTFLLFAFNNINKTTRWQINFLSGTSNKQIEKNKCYPWGYPEVWVGSVKPQIVLNPKKYLYPGMKGGPNNQINGLKQSIYLAIKLNRTFVIPQFRAHQTIGQDVLSAYEMIDVERLRRFISCISIEQFRKKCDGYFDVAFQATKATIQQVRYIESDTGMKIWNVKENKSSLVDGVKTRLLTTDISSYIPVLPNASYINNNQIETLPSDTKSLQKAYNTTASCAIYVFAFGSIKTQLNQRLAFSLIKQNNDVTKIPDDVMYSAVTDAVRHPPCIVEAATSYVREVLAGKDYVAVHWRYDEGDWKRYCKTDFISSTKKRICDAIEGVQPVDIASGIYMEIYKKYQITEKLPDDYTFYIAAPPSMNEFKEQIYNELMKLDDKFARPLLSLETFLSNNYEICWNETNWTNKGALTSLVEMELMIQSSWFFYSGYSSWSSNSKIYRSKQLENGKYQRKQETVVHKVAVEAKLKRIKSSEVTTTKLN